MYASIHKYDKRTRMNHMNKVAHVLITSASYFAFFSESLLKMRGLKAFFIVFIMLYKVTGF